MWYKLLFISLLALAYSGCEQLEECCTPVKKIGDTENVFSNPRVGKTSYYVAFESKLLIKDQRWYFTEEKHIQDTLKITVVDIESGIYTLSEQYTSGSVSYDENLNNPSRDSIQYFTLEPTAKGWIIAPVEDRNSLQSFLFGYAERIELPSSEEISLASGLATVTTLGKRYEDLNLSYNYSPMIYDGAGLHWYYSKKAGMIRVGFIGGMILRGSGWDALDGSINDRR